MLDNLTSGHRQNLPPGVELVRGDVGDAKTVARVLKRGFDEIYHLAAFFANQNSCDHPVDDFRSNALGTVLMLEGAAKLRGLKTFLFASTSSLTGDLDEGLAEGFSTPYMASKFTGELYARYYRRVGAVPVRTVRYYNCYGPGEWPGRYRNVVVNWIEKVLKGEPLGITGDGRETRDFTYVDDIVSGTIAVARSKKTCGPRVYQLGTGKETTIKRLAELVQEACGRTVGVSLTPRRGWDKTMRRRADLTLARRDAGWKPKVSLEQGLWRTVAWYRAHFPSK
ncbi:MAG: GDP-mannose 4,6-dehydratase [Elusimicrobiota bacterium]|nr:MAG: GDP-mannose 4,6-dehydratase [Elusimicrobiota bacterium]